MYAKRIKRIIDIVMSVCGMILFLPVFIAIVFAIKLDSKGPVFFRQERVGKGKEYFNIIKFRTMRTDAPHNVPTHMLRKPETYITRVGRFLRKTSLDELPQLWNILKGDMSVIGPRPALWNQDDLIAEREKHWGVNGWTVNDLRPGLTGWAQINGRDELEIPEKAKLDGEYVQKMSFLFDVRCFFGTIISIFKGVGVVEGGTGALSRKAKGDAADK